MPFINDVLERNRQRIAENHSAASHLVGVRSRFAFEPEHIRETLQASLAGQDHVVDALCRQLKVIKVGLADGVRPLLVMLLLGETGVGKTETVRLLAHCLHNDISGFCRIDMNTLSQGHYSAAITGAPPGYVGSKENLTLFNEEAINGSASRPGIVLFDEIEKASTEVVRSLMNIFDSGKLRLASGTRELSFTNSLVFMTSNLGANQWRALLGKKGGWRTVWTGATDVQRRRCFERALQQHFDAEFLNRIDSVQLYRSIDMSHMQTIISLELSLIKRQLAKKNIEVVVDSQVADFIAQRGHDPNYGARAARRAVRDELMVPLAEYLLMRGPVNLQPAAGKEVVTVSLVAGRVECHGVRRVA